MMTTLVIKNFALIFQAVAEKTAKDAIGGYFILPHPVRSTLKGVEPKNSSSASETPVLVMSGT